MRWTPDGSRLIVSYEVDAPESWLADHSMDLAFGLATLGVIVVIVTIWRIARRPRTPGLRYCNKCNHVITESQVRKRCPECGHDLARPWASATGHGPLMRVLRAWPALALALAMILIGASHFRDCMSRGSSASSEAWPVEAIRTRFRYWKIFRPSKQSSFTRFESWDVPEPGQRWNSTPTHVTVDSVTDTEEVAVAPNGSCIAWARNFENASRNDIRIFDLRTGRTADAWVADQGYKGVVPQGFSDDGMRLFFTIRDLNVPAGSSTPPPTSISMSVRLDSLDSPSATGQKTLGEVSWQEPCWIGRWGGLDYRYHTPAAAAQTLADGRLAWAIASRQTNLDSTGGQPLRCLWVGLEGEIRRFGAGSGSDWPSGDRVATLGEQRVALTWEPFMPSITPDGSFRFTPVDRVSIHTGQCSDPEPQSRWLVQLERPSATLPHVTIQEFLVDSRTHDFTTSDVTGEPHRMARVGGLTPGCATTGWYPVPPMWERPDDSSSSVEPVVSPDSRYVAMLLRWPRPTAGASLPESTGTNHRGWQIWIWPLHATEPEAPALEVPE